VRRSARRPVACVLASGGLDSAVLLRDALRAYARVQPLDVRGGLVWESVEIKYLRRLLRALRAPRLLPLSFIDVPMGDLYGGHWSISGRRAPGFHDGDASVYIPGRNIALFSKAATFCALRRIPVLVSGILDANPFPDGSPAFFRAMERALSAGLGASIRILAPFRRLSKDRVILRGRDLPLDLTFSCINPAPGGRHCGDCCKCAERTWAFSRAKIADPTVYARGPGGGRTAPASRPSSASRSSPASRPSLASRPSRPSAAAPSRTTRAAP
jgi:7-cyano-7-deazaguanine synthase